MSDNEYKDLDRFDLLGIGLVGVCHGVSFRRLLFLIVVGGLVLSAATFLVVGAFI